MTEQAEVPQELLEAWEKRDKDGAILCPMCDYCHTSPTFMHEHWKAKHRPEEPVFENGAWTCPPGYAYPSCPRCFHRYFHLKPEPATGSASPDGGLCQWCCNELKQEATL